MKKLILKIFVTLGLLSVESVYAAEVTCPSSDMIKGVNFFEGFAYEQVEENKWDWLLASHSFTHENNKWNILFGAPLTAQPNELASAIKEAKKILPTLDLDQPKPEIHSGWIYCEYKTSNPNVRITAGTPPIPENAFRRLNFLRK